MVDYYIKCVNEDSDGEIQSVGHGQNINNQVVGTKTKDEVISDIDSSSKDVKTCYYSSTEGDWVAGDDVHTVDGDYIRTDGNDIRADNLENLGECPDDL